MDAIAEDWVGNKYNHQVLGYEIAVGTPYLALSHGRRTTLTTGILAHLVGSLVTRGRPRRLSLPVRVLRTPVRVEHDFVARAAWGALLLETDLGLQREMSVVVSVTAREDITIQGPTAPGGDRAVTLGAAAPTLVGTTRHYLDLAHSMTLALHKGGRSAGTVTFSRECGEDNGPQLQ